MSEQTDISEIETIGKKDPIGRFGMFSLIIAVSALPFLCVSLHRIKDLQDRHVCSFGETPLYLTVNTLSSVLPAVSVTSGLLSLIRCRRTKTRLKAEIPAITGISLSILSFLAYFLLLLELTKRQIH